MKYNNVAAEINHLDTVSKWEGSQQNEWGVELAYKDRQFTCHYYTSVMSTQEPTVKDVLEALFADSSTIDAAGNDFKEWCFELGYNPDSITDLNTFNDCVKNAAGLRYLLNKDFGDIREEIEQEWN